MTLPNALDSYWMPFTPNRRYKSDPKLLAAARGMYYTSADGRQILDAIAGLWCCNAGHGDPRIVAAIQSQAATLDYATAFNLGHPRIFELASRLGDLMPAGLDRLFFVNSGSESVDTALKIALGYHRLRGEGQRTRFIGRERGYHGVGFGGISVGGISGNRKMFGAQLPLVDHLPHTHDLARNAFSRGQPAHGAELADALENIVALHDPSTIAAVIVEPVAGSTGVLPPPVGYLERLRAICDRHGLLLIFDEVITGFGRTGAAFAAHCFGVTPDILTVAKGLTNGAVPMGAVAVKTAIHDTFMTGPDHAVEFAHGFTYSGHPLATAAALATLDVYRDDGLFERATALQGEFESALHGLRGAPHVIDIRNIGLMGAVELTPIAGQPGLRAMRVFDECWARGLLVRTTGDVIALTPPLIVERDQIARIVEIIDQVLRLPNLG